MRNVIMLMLLAVLPVRAQQQFRQLSFEANRVASTATAEGLFTLYASTFGAYGVSNSSAPNISYTPSLGETFTLDSGYLGIEQGGSAPTSASRLDFKVHLSSSSKGGDCGVASITVANFEVSSSSVAKTTAATPLAFGNNGLQVYGNGSNTVCFTVETPDWVTSTNVPNIIISLLGHEN